MSSPQSESEPSYFLHMSGSIQGPFTLKQLQKLVNTCKIEETTVVSVDKKTLQTCGQLPDLRFGFDVFVSHASQDYAVAKQFCKVIENYGYRCWIAPRNILGDDWPGSITEGIKKSKVLLCLLSESVLNPKCKVADEVALAGDLQKKLMLVRIGDVKASGGLALQFARVQWIDAFGNQYESGIDRLLEELGIELSREAILPGLLQRIIRSLRNRSWTLGKRALSAAVTLVVLVATTAFVVSSLLKKDPEDPVNGQKPPIVYQEDPNLEATVEVHPLRVMALVYEKGAEGEGRRIVDEIVRLRASEGDQMPEQEIRERLRFRGVLDKKCHWLNYGSPEPPKPGNGPKLTRADHAAEIKRLIDLVIPVGKQESAMVIEIRADRVRFAYRIAESATEDARDVFDDVLISVGRTLAAEVRSKDQPKPETQLLDAARTRYRAEISAKVRAGINRDLAGLGNRSEIYLVGSLVSELGSMITPNAGDEVVLTLPDLARFQDKLQSKGALYLEEHVPIKGASKEPTKAGDLAASVLRVDDFIVVSALIENSLAAIDFKKFRTAIVSRIGQRRLTEARFN